MSKLETRRIRETAILDGGSVDESAPVIRRVKILGWESKNRRQYLKESVQSEQYGDRVINLNHPDGPNKQRQVQDRFGWFESVVKDDSGIWGDLHYNPEHPYAKQFAWLAKNKPSLVGLSHDAIGTGKTKDGVFVVEKVIEVKSVDLVADPATTKGLFESHMDPELTQDGADESSIAQHIGELIVKICKDSETDPKEKRKKVLKALKLLDDGEKGEVEESEEEEGGAEDAERSEAEDESGKKKTEESVQDLAKKNPGVKQLLERVDRLEAEAALAKKHALAHRLCEESRLPSVLVTKVFLAQLIEAKDEAAMKQLIEDRRSISNIKRPVSSGPARSSGQLDNKSFAQALKG